jgi:hypothetical protein
MTAASLPQQPAWWSGVHRATAGGVHAAIERPRRTLQIGFGLIWLLDAALQYQPYMFGHGLADDIIAPTGPGSPAWVNGPVGWTARLIDHQTVAFNIAFATIQLAIAVGLLFHRTVKPALVVSFVWALSLWWLGEGLGGVLAGPVPPAAGLPGAAVIYAVLSVALWPARVDLPGRSVAERSPLRRIGTGVIWLALWVSFVFEALRPADRSPTALQSLVAGNEDGEPAWLKAILRWGASGLAGHGTEVSIATAVAFALVAGFGLSPIGRRPALILAIVLAGLIWVFGEAFGEIPTGQATDPNTGPLLALLALSLWPTVAARTKSGEAA